jgi:YaiO family outer membrane protein
MRLLALCALAAAATPATAAELEAGYVGEVLSSDRPAWHQAYLEALWTGADRRGLALSLREYERFDRLDTELWAAGDLALASEWSLALEASGSPTHQVIPVWSGAARVRRGFDHGLGATLGLRLSRYQSGAGAGTVSLGSAELERYWGRFRLGWTGYLATLSGMPRSPAPAVDLLRRAQPGRPLRGRRRSSDRHRPEPVGSGRSPLPGGPPLARRRLGAQLPIGASASRRLHAHRAGGIRRHSELPIRSRSRWGSRPRPHHRAALRCSGCAPAARQERRALPRRLSL